MNDEYTEEGAIKAGELVYRNGQQAWCLCSDCRERHASRNKRRTRHDHWAISGHDRRIYEDVAS